MAIIRKTRTNDYIVVHHVYGEQDVIDFLRMTSRTVVDRLFFEAKNHGQSSFTYRNQIYLVNWTNQDLFVIEQEAESTVDVG